MKRTSRQQDDDRRRLNSAKAAIESGAAGREFSLLGVIHPSTEREQAGLANPIQTVYFRAGLLAARESLARFVEQGGSPEIAASIRANWWPRVGPDLGPPRKLAFEELAEWDNEKGVVKAHRGPEVVTPTLEALPIAQAFLDLQHEPPSQEPRTEKP